VRPRLAQAASAVKVVIAPETAPIKNEALAGWVGRSKYDAPAVLMIDSAGKVYVVEEQLDVDKAPAPVRAALEAKGTIVDDESELGQDLE
jgi:hypothetical protein